MISIKGTTISMTRGDTLIVQVDITRDGEPYVPQAGDTVRFAMKHQKMNAQKSEYQDAAPLLTVDIPTDTLVLRIDSDVTKPFGFGDYVYDIQLTYADGTVDTFIADATIALTPEVD